VDVLVIIPSSAIRAAKQATQAIPIVIATTADPVATGLVTSLARPGGNITGVTRITRDLNEKRLELIKDVVSQPPRIGVLYQEDSTSGLSHFKEYESAAHRLKVEVQSLAIQGKKPDIDSAFQSATRGRVGGLITISNSLMQINRKKIVNLAMKHQLPSIFESTHWVDAGGLMSYSANEAEQYKRAAVYVDKILKGAKPADLPIEQPTKFELVVNLKTAKQIGVTIPSIILARTDRVIR
jgi:putative ABC transport system substrate-binding protein